MPTRGSDQIRLFALAAGLLLLVGGSLSATGLGAALAWLGPEVVAAGVITPGDGPARPLAPRTDCAAITGTDLRSPEEGLWFERHCATPTTHRSASTSTCNRSELSPTEFHEIAPNLFTYRGDRSDHAYLWYRSAEACFDLVSSRLVSAVCADMTVTFRWGPDACVPHGGILARVNGR